MKGFLLSAAASIVSVALAAACLEFYLTWRGYGTPPLYQYDPAVGYVLQPSQDIRRLHGCRIHINNLGMRSPDTTPSRPDGIYRVLVLGDSVPYGGSYIDQEDTFCYVAERNLNADGKRFEILNAGVNAYGPQNVRRYLETRGTYESNLIVVFFPWGDLRRDFMNFYIVPFWQNTPGWAIGELFRHVCWMAIGRLSREWKGTEAFENELCLTHNLDALVAIKGACDRVGTPIFFFWSPYKDDLLLGRDVHTTDDVAGLYRRLPDDLLIDLGPMFKKQTDISSLYEDGCHYSKAGHHLVGRVLADFIKMRHEESRYSVSLPNRGRH